MNTIGTILIGITIITGTGTIKEGIGPTSMAPMSL